MAFVLGLYESNLRYERTPDFEPDDSFDDVDAAVSAGQQWLRANPRGVVEVIELRKRSGSVVRVVTSTNIEVLPFQIPAPTRSQRLASWISRSIKRHVVHHRRH